MPVVPLSDKILLTLEEASALTGVGVNKLRSISNSYECDLVVWIGNKRLLKRTNLIAFLENAYSI